LAKKTDISNIMKKYLVCLITLLLLVGSFLPFAQPVYADTLYLRPNGPGDETNIQLQHPDSNYHWDKVDEEVADGNTTYVHQGGAPYLRDLYSLSDPPPSAQGTINWINVWFVARRGSTQSGPSHGETAIKIGGVAYNGDEKTFNDETFFGYSTAYSTNPTSGLAWTWADLANLQAGVSLKGDAQNGPICTQVYVEVNYTSYPTVITSAADEACVTANLNGSIEATGGAVVDYYAFVWDTTSHEDPGDTVPDATDYADYWLSDEGDYDVDDYDYEASLSEETEYFFRFAAHNSEGWFYGEELSFTTWGDPTVFTEDATSVTATTARLQAYLDEDNGQECEVRWGYGETDEGNDIEAYDTYTEFAGSYETGESPYLDISELDTGVTYYYNIEAQNDCGTDTGTSHSFLTEAEVGSPSNVVAIPDVDNIILSWVKGVGASNTFIRFKKNACPASEADGTLIYLGTASTYTHENLESGADYCYFVIGYDAVAGYSDNFTIVHATTLAAGITPVGEGEGVDKPAGGMTTTPQILDELVEKVPLLHTTEKDAEAAGMLHAYFLFGLLLIVLTGLSFYVYRWQHSIETIILIWVLVSWITVPLLHVPWGAALFVTLVGGGYAVYRQRSIA
jgi:hypothetical protein